MKEKSNRIAFFVGHPAHFHLFKNTAKNLINKGYQVDFLVKRKDVVEQLVKEAGFNYFVVRGTERKSSSKVSLITSLLAMDLRVARYLVRKSPSMLLGTYTPVISRIVGIPVISCNEDDFDVVPNFARLSYPYAKDILAPSVCDCGKWNDNAIKYNSYHELAYLHPSNFTPDKSVVEKYFSTEKPYCIIRFAKLNAHHDSGIKGITTGIARRIIDILSPYMSIYITSERELEPQFERYRIKIDPIDMHHIMAYASLYIGDSQTMAAEAGVLGVPFVRFNDFVGRIGYLIDLEDNYHLGYGIKTNEVDRLYKTVEELVKIPNIKQVYYKRKQLMLSEKIDFTAFMTWFVENYPKSRTVMKQNPDYQYNFR